MTTIRRPGGVSVMVLVVLVATVGVAQLLAPEWVHHVGLDVWTVATDRAAWREAREERVEMDAKAECHVRRREAATQVAAQLAAGDISLPVAADHLALLFPDDGSRLTLTTAFYMAPTERHLFALHAAERVSRISGQGFARRELIFTRLEAEYRTLNPRGEASDATAPTVARVDEIR